MWKLITASEDERVSRHRWEKIFGFELEVKSYLLVCL